MSFHHAGSIKELRLITNEGEREKEEKETERKRERLSVELTEAV